MPNPNIKAGMSILAKSTDTIRNCGINADRARGNVCRADGTGVSIYLDKGTGGFIEAFMSYEAYGLNFNEDKVRPDNATYIRQSHFKKRFPDDFLIVKR